MQALGNTPSDDFGSDNSPIAGGAENANGHERQSARTSGVTHRYRGRQVTELEGFNVT
jgi:hypothetical protein